MKDLCICVTNHGGFPPNRETYVCHMYPCDDAGWHGDGIIMFQGSEEACDAFADGVASLYKAQGITIGLTCL